jgi:predicted transcriptional regulator YdeE
MEETNMKNTNLTVSFDTEKLDALTYHMGKKDADLQTELKDTVQKLYEKYVPQATREYIDDKLSRETAEKPKPKRPVRPAVAGGSEGSMT